MLFFINNLEDIDDIPDNYKKVIISNNKLLLNRANTIDFSRFVPTFKCTDDEIKNRKKYLRQIKDNELLIVSLFYANSVLADTENSLPVNIVFICDKNEYEGFNFIKIFRKFIHKYYGIKVFKLTYDVTLSMINESEMSPEGSDRYTLKLMEFIDLEKK